MGEMAAFMGAMTGLPPGSASEVPRSQNPLQQKHAAGDKQ